MIWTDVLWIKASPDDKISRAEGEGIVSPKTRRASEQGSFRTFIIGVGIGVRAIALEVAVKGNTCGGRLEEKIELIFSTTPTRRRASISGAMGPSAAIRRVF